MHPVPDRYTEPEFRKYFDSAVASKMAFVFVDRATGRLIGSSRYYGYEPELSEIEIGWTFMARSHWGGATNREVKRLMLDHAFGFVDTVDLLGRRAELALAGRDEKDRRRQRDGLFTRELSGAAPYIIFEIGKTAYQQGGRALVG